MELMETPSISEDLPLIYEHFSVFHFHSAKENVFTGFIVGGEKMFQIHLNVPDYPRSLRNLSLYTDWALSNILKKQKKALHELSDECTSVYSYLEGLQKITEMCLKKEDYKKVWQNSYHLSIESYKHVLVDLRQIGWQIGYNVVTYVSPCLTNVKLQVVDDANRIHTLMLHLGCNYPHSHIQIGADLPQEPLDLLRSEVKKNVLIIDLYKVFENLVKTLQPVWSVLNDVDETCWVIDPVPPFRKDTGRRIRIDTNVSIHIALNWKLPEGKPDIKFLGREKEILRFKGYLIENHKCWSLEENFMTNLCVVLGLSSFPHPRGKSQYSRPLVMPGECIICLTKSLEGELPSQACNNKACVSCFHATCLIQWFKTLPMPRESFNRIYGECPYCNSAISCPTQIIKKNTIPTLTVEIKTEGHLQNINCK